jgi:hypothetical protein
VKLYVAGRMQGEPDHGVPAFNAAARELRRAGYDVENPADIGVRDGWQWTDYMRAGLKLLLDCDGVAVLDNWRSSRGATHEVDVAHNCGLLVMPVDDWLRFKGDGLAQSAQSVPAPTEP